MLLDDLLPTYDATRVEHRVVAGRPAEVYEVALNVDFLDAVRRNRAVRGRVCASGRRRARRRPAARRAPADPPEPESLRLADMGDPGDWMRLGADPPNEIAFGVIGRFWSGETQWEQIESSEFAAFDRPGFAKIACNLSFRPYGDKATLVSYEARTKATDEASRRAFLRYWRVVSPGVGIVMRSLLKVIAQD